jgi:hypothetical protein
MEPDEWIVGIKRSDGQNITIKSNDSVDPSSVVEVTFPLSFPWESDSVLLQAPMEQVEVRDRSMGPERHYSARLEDSVPNSNEFWSIELELWEYPPNSFNMSRLTHTDQIRNAVWDREDLLNAME